MILSKVYSMEALLKYRFPSKLKHARECLIKYVSERESRYVYECNDVLKTSNKARDIWAQDTYNVMMAAEAYLEEGQTILISQTPNIEGIGIEFDINMRDGFFKSINNHLAINSSKVRTVAEVSYDGEKYYIKSKFYVFDYYDWDKNDKMEVGIASPVEMYSLCRAGYARFYENWGVYETQFSWEPTVQGREDALKIEKEIMKQGR